MYRETIQNEIKKLEDKIERDQMLMSYSEEMLREHREKDEEGNQKGILEVKKGIELARQRIKAYQAMVKALKGIR